MNHRLDPLDLIHLIAEETRADLEARYPLPLYGRCIEATEIILDRLSSQGLRASLREGWCEYQDEAYGTSHPYDEHVWCEVILPGQDEVLVIDVTLDQFQGGFFDELPRLYVGPRPEFFVDEEPQIDDDYDDGVDLDDTDAPSGRMHGLTP